MEISKDKYIQTMRSLKKILLDSILIIKNFFPPIDQKIQLQIPFKKSLKISHLKARPLISLKAQRKIQGSVEMIH